jgi:membrane protein implicated in regulation of membrane protease activity
MDNILNLNISIEVWFIILWFAIIIFSAILEALTMDLTSIWFALAALVAFILAIFNVNIAIQLIVFIVISVGLLISVRPLAQNYFRTNVVSTNSDRLIGKSAVCTKSILKGGRGEVKVNSQIWTAISQDESDILENDTVEILAIEGVKLIVKKA